MKPSRYDDYEWPPPGWLEWVGVIVAGAGMATFVVCALWLSWKAVFG